MDAPTRAVTAKADTASEPKHRKAEAALAFEAAVTKKIGVDGAIDGVERQVRDDDVVDLFPHPCAIGNF
jgi:hypothetical protein